MGVTTMSDLSDPNSGPLYLHSKHFPDRVVSPDPHLQYKSTTHEDKEVRIGGGPASSDHS